MIKCLAFFAVMLVCIFKFGYAYNTTASLPYKHFIIVKYSKIKVNDYVLFAAPNVSVYKGFNLIKQVKGKSSDKIVLQGRDVYINSQYVGAAKQKTLNGESLDIINELTIPENKFYVTGSSVDSFDSRYSNFGLIDENNIIGVAYPLW